MNLCMVISLSSKRTTALTSVESFCMLQIFIISKSDLKVNVNIMLLNTGIATEWNDVINSIEL